MDAAHFCLGFISATVFLILMELVKIRKIYERENVS